MGSSFAKPRGKAKVPVASDALSCGSDLQTSLKWNHLVISTARGIALETGKNREVLLACGETQKRLREFPQWQKSSIFTPREKAAFTLAETLAYRRSEDTPSPAFKEARKYFNRMEMIELTLSIFSYNELLDHYTNRRIRVLVVEDDPQDQELFRIQLQRAKMEEHVILVSDAQKALVVLDSFSHGNRRDELIAIFLDLGLPGMSGLDLLRHVRSTPRIKRLPVVVMTAYTDPRYANECRKLRVASYIEKPLTLDSFSQAVANIFHQTHVSAKREGERSPPRMSRCEEIVPTLNHARTSAALGSPSIP